MNQNNMVNISLSKLNKWLLATILFSLFLILVTLILFGKQVDSDTGSYISTINNFLQGNFSSLESNRVLRSGGLLLIIPIAKITSPLAALLLENYLSYIISGVLVFLILNKVIKDEYKSFLGAMFFLTTFPILRFGLAALTDMLAWLFFLLTVYLSIIFYKNIKAYHLVILGLIAGLGFIVKESGGMGVLFILSLLFFVYRNNWRKFIKFLLYFSSSFLFIVILNQIFVYNIVHFTYLDWYLFNTKTYAKESYTIINWFKNLFILFGVGWLFVLVGIKEKFDFIKNDILVLSLILPSISFIFWPSITARLMYISGLLFSILSVLGFDYLYSKNKIFTFVLFLVSMIVNLILVGISHI